MLIMAIILMAVLTSIAFAGLHFASGNLLQSENNLSVTEARMQTESGISYLVLLMKNTDIEGVKLDQDLLDAVATNLSEELDWSPAMSGVSISYDGNTITIPPISSQGTGSFQATVTIVDKGTIQLSVTGASGSVTRWAALKFQLVEKTSKAFSFGVASKGPIVMSGNAKVLGANDPEEAQCLSATYDTDEAFSLTGDCNILGGISICNGSGYARLKGGVEVGGDEFKGLHTVDSEAVNDEPEEYESFKIGIEDVEFPEIDSSIFEPFAVNVIDASTPTPADATYNNIRIKANSNLTFNSNTTLNGVIYIETPNNIRFNGNATINGVIVTQDAGDSLADSSAIVFLGTLSARGVDYLPETSQFEELRKIRGTFLLAPGFITEFGGNFGTIGGTIAAEKIMFTGNASGIINGSIMSYGPEELDLAGNSTIIIDRSGCPDDVPGFSKVPTFEPVPNSYVEK